MNDYEYIFKSETAEKKRIANNAKYRTGTRGGRSCRLSSDKLTKAQWQAKNGKIYSITLLERHTWAHFKALPTSLQEEYLKALIENYNPRQRDVAIFLGVAPNTFSAYCRKNIDNVKFTNLAKTPSYEWLEYLRRLDNIEKGLEKADAEEPVEEEPIAEEEAAEEEIVEEPVEFVPNRKAENTYGQMTFKGNPIDAFKRIEALFDADKDYTITIYYKENENVSE